jgi:hypothetical protein
MRPRFEIWLASVALLSSASPVEHHSSAAEDDARKPVTLKGAVTWVEWTSSHARCCVDVKDEHGIVANWNLELASPNILASQGWTRHSLKPGDIITVEGSMAKDGAKTANAQTVVLPDGRKVFSTWQQA